MASKTHLLVVWWILSAWIVNLSTVRSQSCASSTPYVGPGTAATRSEYTTASFSDALFLIANGHPIDCYGIVTSWSFKSALDLNSSCYKSTAQIWRPSPTNSMEYFLVGENILFDKIFCSDNLAGNGSEDTRFPPLSTPPTLNVPPSSRIPVQPLDVIAWYDTDFEYADPDRKIGFDPGLPASWSMSTVYVLPGGSVCSPVVGSACSFQTSSVVGRNYGIEILFDAGRPPVILNLPSTLSITELLPAGTFLFQVQANNSFTWNPTITPPLQYTILTTCNMSWFAIDPANGSVRVDNLFNVNTLTAPVTCELDVQVQQNGAPPSNSVLTVIVANINEPHQIDNLPYTVPLDSATTTLGQLVTLLY